MSTLAMVLLFSMTLPASVIFALLILLSGWISSRPEWVSHCAGQALRRADLEDAEGFQELLTTGGCGPDNQYGGFSQLSAVLPI